MAAGRHLEYMKLLQDLQDAAYLAIFYRLSATGKQVWHTHYMTFFKHLQNFEVPKNMSNKVAFFVMENVLISQNI